MSALHLRLIVDKILLFFMHTFEVVIVIASSCIWGATKVAVFCNTAVLFYHFLTFPRYFRRMYRRESLNTAPLLISNFKCSFECDEARSIDVTYCKTCTASMY